MDFSNHGRESKRTFTSVAAEGTTLAGKKDLTITLDIPETSPRATKEGWERVVDISIQEGFQLAPQSYLL